MTTAGKCFAVLITALSLTFVGVVSVTQVGGPGFAEHLDDPVLDGFYFERKDDGWSVVTISKYGVAVGNGRFSFRHFDVIAGTALASAGNTGDSKVFQQLVAEAKTTRLLADAVLKARRFKKQQQDNEVARLNTILKGGVYVQSQQGGQARRYFVGVDALQAGGQVRPGQRVQALVDGQMVQGNVSAIVPGLKQQIDDRRALNERDLNAMQARLDAMSAKLLASRKTEASLRQTILSHTEESKKRLEEARRRREDVSRLRDEIAQIEADQYRLTIQQRKLETVLMRVQSIVDRLERRRKQLLAAGADPNYDGTAPAIRESKSATGVEQ